MNHNQPGNIKQTEIVKIAEEAAKQPEPPKSIEPSPIEKLIPATDRALAQEEIERETSLVRLRSERLRLRKEELELEKLEDDVKKIQQQKETERLSAETVQSALGYEQEHQIWHETECTHMKGGQSESMLGNAPSKGNDASNYAVIDHTLSTGVRFRMCMRCGKTWFPKDPDYREAMSWPTRNSPSQAAGGAGMVRDWKKVQVASTLPHKRKQQPQFDQF